MELPDTMKALTLRQDGYSGTVYGGDLDDIASWVELREVPVPVPGQGQALVKVARAAVNPSDVLFIKGNYGQPRRSGLPAGFEGTGTVVAGDTPLVGQRVAFSGSASGTWAEYSLGAASGLIPLRPDVSDDDAAGLIVNPITAMAMFDLARQAGAKSIVVTAAGSQLGKFLAGLGREHDVPCISVVRRSDLVRPLKDLGAAEVLVETDAGYADARDAALARLKPTVLLDAVAGPVSAGLFSAMPPDARWVVYGRLSSEAPRLENAAQLVFQNKRIEGFWLSRWFSESSPDAVGRVIADVQEHFADGRWKTDIAGTVPLAEAIDRLPAVYGDKDSKVLIAP